MGRVSLDQVSKRFDDVAAVDELTLDVADEELLVLLGPSGCGKSTALRMIAGLEDPTSGTITIGDRVVNDVEAKDRDISMVFQSYTLYPHMTVRRNIEFPLRSRKVAVSERDQLVRDAAESLSLGELLDRKPAQLSGGQRQRACGRAARRATGSRPRRARAAHARTATFRDRSGNSMFRRTGHVRVERVALEHHRMLAVLGLHVVDDAVTDGDGPRRRVFEPHDHAQRSRLPAARRAEEHEELLVGDVEGQLVDGGDVVEALGDLVQRDPTHRAGAPFRPGHAQAAESSFLGGRQNAARNEAAPPIPTTAVTMSAFLGSNGKVMSKAWSSDHLPGPSVPSVIESTTSGDVLVPLLRAAQEEAVLAGGW